MIKFFRKIRQKLLTENKFTKYLIYAVGEIILVVIGILIALQVNNWNTQRINNRQEKEILFQLKDEFKKNLLQLNQKISVRNSVIHSSFQLLSYRKEKAGLIEIDSFNINLTQLYSTPTFDPALGVTTELSNSGKLYLIRDKELRNLITTWPSYLSQLQEEELNIKQWVEYRFMPFLITNYQVGPSLDRPWLAEYINALSSLSKEKQVTFSGLFDKADFETLLHNPDFEDYLALEISNNVWANLQAIDVKEQIDMIIAKINKELNDKQE